MNDEVTNLTTVSDEDLALVEQELGRTPQPRSTHRTSPGSWPSRRRPTERTQDVKKYDPYARYEVGDFIEKDYDEPLTVGSKSVEHFEGRVILKVVAKTYLQALQLRDARGRLPRRRRLPEIRRLHEEDADPGPPARRTATAGTRPPRSWPRATTPA